MFLSKEMKWNFAHICKRLDFMVNENSKVMIDEMASPMNFSTTDLSDFITKMLIESIQNLINVYDENVKIENGEELFRAMRTFFWDEKFKSMNFHMNTIGTIWWIFKINGLHLRMLVNLRFG